MNDDNTFTAPDFDTWFMGLCTGESEGPHFDYDKEQGEEFMLYMKLLKHAIAKQNDKHNAGRYMPGEKHEQIMAILRELHHNLTVKQVRAWKRRVAEEARRQAAFPPPRLVQ